MSLLSLTLVPKLWPIFIQKEKCDFCEFVLFYRDYVFEDFLGIPSKECRNSKSFGTPSTYYLKHMSAVQIYNILTVWTKFWRINVTIKFYIVMYKVLFNKFCSHIKVSKGSIRRVKYRCRVSESEIHSCIRRQIESFSYFQ